MKKRHILAMAFVGLFANAQEHFAGIGLSSRVGVLNTQFNPAELNNMSDKFDVNLFGLSANVSNNKLSINDIINNDNLDNILFRGTEPVNLRADVQVSGFGMGIKFKRFALGLSTKIYGNMDIIDVDPRLGDAFVNAGVNSIFGTTTVANNYNQRVNGTAWGEIAGTVAFSLINKEKHKFNVGFTGKLLLPGSFANMGLDKFTGTISRVGGVAYLTNTQASLNFAYSGELANSFTQFDNYSKSAIGSVGGVGFDLGVNYQWRDKASDNPKKNQNRYKLNLGMALRNVGSMTFKDPNNKSTNYQLSIQGTQSLNLNQFENVESIQDIETILLNSGYLTKTTSNKDFKVSLPTTFVMYADVKVIAKFFVSGYIQQRVKSIDVNDQIAVQNNLTITPHVNLGFFEFFLPFTQNEISGFNTGIGIRAGGFYIGSGSGVTALLNDAKQADVYLGWRFGIF